MSTSPFSLKYIYIIKNKTPKNLTSKSFPNNNSILKTSQKPDCRWKNEVKGSIYIYNLALFEEEWRRQLQRLRLGMVVDPTLGGSPVLSAAEYSYGWKQLTCWRWWGWHQVRRRTGPEYRMADFGWWDGGLSPAAEEGLIILSRKASVRQF